MTEQEIQQKHHRALRDALGQFATGVTIITTSDAQDAPVGLTVNSFNSVSLDPPLVLWSLMNSSGKLDAFSRCTHWAVHVLGVDQQALSQRFASSCDRFAGIDFMRGPGNVPLLDGCVARYVCSNHLQHEGGDHRILIGRVEQFEQFNGEPLLFHGGHYCQLGNTL